MDIEKIPKQELIKDREESLVDIKVCRKALSLGVTNYSGGSTQERLDINLQILDKIDNEILRRMEKDVNN